MTPEYFQRFARYNRWANRRVFEICARMRDNQRRRDRKAFFGSIHNTLNHLLVTDRIWIARLTGEPHGIKTLDQILFDDFEPLTEARATEDERLIDLTDELTEEKLATVLRYSDMAGVPLETRRDMVYANLFNHQTHHRGQVHAMISQAGREPPSLDLIDFLHGG